MPHPPKAEDAFGDPPGDDLTSSAEVNSACGEVWPLAKRSDGVNAGSLALLAAGHDRLRQKEGILQIYDL